jgi:hypothetical protein
MRDRRGQSRFVLEAGDELVRVRELRMERLDRNGTIEIPLLCQPDRAESA